MQLAKPLLVGVHTRVKRLLAAENSSSRGATEWCGAMRIGKDNASLGQAIHMGRLDLRVAPKEPDPVIHVIDRDEQYFRASNGLRRTQDEKTKGNRLYDA